MFCIINSFIQIAKNTWSIFPIRCLTTKNCKTKGFCNSNQLSPISKFSVYSIPNPLIPIVKNICSLFQIHSPIFLSLKFPVRGLIVGILNPLSSIPRWIFFYSKSACAGSKTVSGQLMLSAFAYILLKV